MMRATIRRRAMRAGGATALALASGAAAAPGDVLWRHTSATGAFGGEVAVGPGGQVYWQVPAYFDDEGGVTIRAYRPDGTPVWTTDWGGDAHLAIGPDGTLYAAGANRDDIGGVSNTVVALDPADGEPYWVRHLYDEEFMPNYGFIGGVNLGPDGNLYVAADGPYQTPAFAMSLTSGGQVRWWTPGYGNNAGSPSSHFAFIDGKAIKVENRTPIPSGMFGSSSGITALEMETGEMVWYQPYGVGSGWGRNPAALPAADRVYSVNGAAVLVFNGDGASLGSFVPLSSQQSLIDLTPGPGGRLYGCSYAQMHALDEDLNVLWSSGEGKPPNASFNSLTTLSPDASMAAASATIAPYQGGTVAGVVVYDTAGGSLIASATFESPPGAWVHPRRPAFSPDGSTLYVSVQYGDDDPGPRPYYVTELVAIALTDGAAPCAADFNQDGTPDVSDFSDFRAAYLAGNMDADYSGNGSLGVEDFTAFRAAYLAGCP